MRLPKNKVPQNLRVYHHLPHEHGNIEVSTVFGQIHILQSSERWTRFIAVFDWSTIPVFLSILCQLPHTKQPCVCWSSLTSLLFQMTDKHGNHDDSTTAVWINRQPDHSDEKWRGWLNLRQIALNTLDKKWQHIGADPCNTVKVPVYLFLLSLYFWTIDP